MTIEEIFQEKSIKAKQRVKHIGDWLLNDELPMDELIAFAETQSVTTKATCIEAIEYATKQKPEILDETLFVFVTSTSGEEDPRIKWESARVIGNIAKMYPHQLEEAIAILLKNATHKGNVVRWASAFALSEILKLKTEHNIELIPKVEKLSKREEDNAIIKKYAAALKKAMK